jgi:hypothetical protein
MMMMMMYRRFWALCQGNVRGDTIRGDPTVGTCAYVLAATTDQGPRQS